MPTGLCSAFDWSVHLFSCLNLLPPGRWKGRIDHIALLLQDEVDAQLSTVRPCGQRGGDGGKAEGNKSHLQPPHFTLVMTGGS